MGHPLKGKFKYQLSKLAPFGSDISIKLKNGLEFIVRARTMDRSIIKEVWMQDIYNQHGICVEEGDTVIDIGAHVGIFSIYAANRSKTGKVFAFEPFIENFKRLENHKKINAKSNLSVYNLGMSNIEGTQTLNLSPDNNTGGHSIHLKTESDNKIEIQTIRLADFCKQEKIDQIDFLKLDCEGAEFDIIKSDMTILSKVSKIIMECHPYGENTVPSMVKLLEDNGFKVFRQEGKSDDETQMLYCKK